MSSSLEAASIERLHAAFVEAFRNNDLEALGGFYTDTAVLLPPARALLSGREAIVAFWKGAERIQDLAFQPTDIRMLGDAAMREVGTLEITARGQGRETRTAQAKYMSLWLKVDGGWKLDSSVWNGSGGGQRGGRNQGGGRGGQGGGGQGGGGRGQGGGGGRNQGGRGQGGGGRGGQGGGGRGGQGGGGGGRGGQGGGYGQGGGGGYGQGGGQNNNQGGYGGGRGQGGGGRRGGGGGQGGGGGFGPRARHQRANQDAPMIPRID